MRLIDADALIERIDKSQAEGFINKNSQTYILVALSQVFEIIKKQPTIEPEPQWIPCNERLPEAQTEVIVSCTDDSGDTKFRYTSSGWITTDKEYWIVDNEINNFVVAWREMPEPYKGEQE